MRAPTMESRFIENAVEHLPYVRFIQERASAEGKIHPGRAKCDETLTSCFLRVSGSMIGTGDLPVEDDLGRRQHDAKRIEVGQCMSVQIALIAPRCQAVTSSGRQRRGRRLASVRHRPTGQA